MATATVKQILRAQIEDILNPARQGVEHDK